MLHAKTPDFVGNLYLVYGTGKAGIRRNRCAPFWFLG
ncbi:hypothetical protein APA386B_1131 [Acetobacter pasteurianus 386B]|nr:hypothetical protein APA386B_1131 [Acetobacter pasteurianus 386B]